MIGEGSGGEIGLMGRWGYGEGRMEGAERDDTNVLVL